MLSGRKKLNEFRTKPAQNINKNGAKRDKNFNFWDFPTKHFRFQSDFGCVQLFERKLEIWNSKPRYSVNFAIFIVF